LHYNKPLSARVFDSLTHVRYCHGYFASSRWTSRETSERFQSFAEELLLMVTRYFGQGEYYAFIADVGEAKLLVYFF
jgi:hypothetical protein